MVIADRDAKFVQFVQAQVRGRQEAEDGFYASLERLTKHRDRLEHEQDRLMQAHYADTRTHLDDALNLLTDIYQRCDDANRRLCNQAFFSKVYIDEDDQLRVENNRPFEMLLDPERLQLGSER